MDQERWRTVEELFHATLAHSPEARQAFLEAACSSDTDLRLQVERLLAKDEEAGRFLETPAMPISMATRTTTGVLVGRQFGPYRIVFTIGVGGMGEVYRAHDSKLGRDVAIKTLPPEFAGNSERLTLFRREARTLASVNHPHIAAIYGLEELEGMDCLVLELVEGEILHGPLPVPIALDRARQVAEALEAAHAKGIIHRDLKPANVKVTPEGTVKVLDFGLAKAMRGPEQNHNLSQAAAMTGESTLAGNVVGTPGYMSPEQARGEEVDKRTDIWAFGCLLYELLSGKRAFYGETHSNTIAAMLEGEPDWHALPAKTPQKIRKLLRKCLEKAADRRLASITNARRTIEEVQRGRNRWRVAAIATAAAFVLGELIVDFRRPQQNKVSEPTILPAISLPDDQSMPALSADGSRLAFVWDGPKRDSGIFAAVLGGQGPVRLTKNDGDCCPAWSPDGRYVGFLRFEGSRFSVMTVPSAGGREKTIFSGAASPDADRDSNIGSSFSADGKLLAFPEWHSSAQQSSVAAVSLQDLSFRSLTSPPTGLRDGRPAFSPDGTKLAFVRSSEASYSDELFVASRLGGEPKQLTFDHRRIFGAPSWALDGRELVFSSNRAGLAALWRVPASGGIPQRVTGTGPGAWYPSVSSSGSVLAYEIVDEEENLWRVALKDPHHAIGEASIVVPAAKTNNLVPQFSPDGRKIAFQSERSGYHEIWISDANGSNLTQSTDLQRFAGSPRWSPDGRYIAFDFRGPQHSEIDLLDTVTGHTGVIAAFPTADNVVPSWSRDGRWVYFASNLKDGFQIWRAMVNNGVALPQSALQITRNGGYAAFESMDGREVLYTKTNQPGIWATTLENGNEHVVWRGPGPDYWSNWAVAKDGIFLLAPEGDALPEIQFLEFKTGRVWHIGKLAKPSFYGFAVSPDERSLVYSQWDRSERSILLAKNFR